MVNIAHMDEVEDTETIDSHSMYSGETHPTEIFPPPKNGSDLRMQINLPSIPPLLDARQTFSAEWLSLTELEACGNVGLLSSLSAWIGFLTQTIEADFTGDGVRNALAKLFTFKVSALHWVQAETIAAQVINSLLQQGFLFPQGQYLTVRPDVTVSGVITPLSHGGCYSPRQDCPYLCYSFTCMAETPELVDSGVELMLRRTGSVSGKRMKSDGTGYQGLYEPDWNVFWGITVDMKSKTSDEKREILRQYAIHEAIVNEAGFVRRFQSFIDVYSSLEKIKPPIMKEQDLFCERVFPHFRKILAIQKDFLVKLKIRQVQQGPYIIDSVADIFIEWYKVARKAWMEAEEPYPWVSKHLDTQMRTSPEFENFLAECSRDKRMKESTSQEGFFLLIPRAPRYRLMIQSILKKTLETSPDYPVLKEALECMKQMSDDCDSALDAGHQQLNMQRIDAKIVFKNSQVEVELGLGNRRRKLFKKGKLLRKSGIRRDWIDTDIILMDHYLIMAKLRKTTNGTSLIISKRPILLDLLVIESASDDPITGFTLFGAGPDEIEEISDSSGEDDVTTKVRKGSTASQGSHEGKDLLYPIRITHLGREGDHYTFYAKSKEERDEWVDAIIKAKTAFSAANFARNSEPFRLKLLSAHFGYPDGEAPTLLVEANSTALTRCLGDSKTPNLITKVRIRETEMFGRDYYFISTGHGIFFCSDVSKQHWRQCLAIPNQAVQVVEEFNLLLIISGSNLIWYRLDEIVHRGFDPQTNNSMLPRGERINPSGKVIFFRIAFLRDRLCVLYLTNDGALHVVEPIRHKAIRPGRQPTTLAKRFLGPQVDFNTVDYFRASSQYHFSGDLKRFTAFHQSVLLHLSKGFTYFNLENKGSHQVPTNTVVSHGLGGKSSKVTPSAFGAPLGAFRVSADRILMCYKACCIQCTNGGRLIQPLTKFIGTPESVAFHEPYVVAVSKDLVEVRKVEVRSGSNGSRAKLCQIITGQDIRLVSHADGQVRLVMAHPSVPGRQLLVELVSNEFVKLDESSSLTTL